MIDTHCHLDFPEFDPDRDEVIRRAKEAGIDFIINAGSSLQNSISSVELARRYENVYAAVGIHPHDADTFDKNTLDAIIELAKKDKVVALGEIGLDYFKNFSKKENQLPAFVSLIKVAKDIGLPLIIHSREAKADTLRILKEAMPVSAVVHCFSGDEEFLKSCLDLGFFVSFTCNLTYKKAQNLRDLVKQAPLDRLMLETDAPYLSPEGQRGRRNEPANVRLLAELVAEIRGVSLDDIARATTDNAKKFFRLEG
ncbi:MAG: TatD family hydrolase [Candidatus Omnitrophica bacterium]|nr:TatD family hydrolase [Candidatus Omnitrophota bacterium]MBU1869052.1 TatD family hydrolase [Candidatus Omnitrophota bacterium]